MSLSSDNVALTMPVQPANGNGSNGGFGWGGDWSSWIILFLIWGIFGWGNGGYGGFGGGGGVNNPGLQGLATRADINEGFALNGLQNGQTSIRDAVTSGFHGVDTAVCNLGYQTQAGFNALGAQLASCCCDPGGDSGCAVRPRHHRLRYAKHHPEYHSGHHRQRQRQQPGDFGFPDSGQDRYFDC